MVILGIDYGLKRVGLAISEAGLARPLAVIDNSLKTFKQIAEVCVANGVERIVVGLPEGRLATAVEEFAKELSDYLKLPIELCDETLTTREAVAKMIAGHKKLSVRRKQKDAFAAACLLQKYSEERRGNV